MSAPVPRTIQDEMFPRTDFRNIPVAGLEPMTTIDFPGKLAAVLFTRGCPWNCRYCHNSSLRDAGECLSWEGIETFFRERVGFLDGVVISGGEPLLHPEMPGLLAWLREMGYATAVHTNGNYPAMLMSILRKNLVDYVAMDIKAPPGLYDRVTRTPDTCIEVARSISIIIESGVEYEFRTTWHSAVLSACELLDTVRAVSLVGGKRFFIQRFHRDGVADLALAEGPECEQIPAEIIAEAQKLFPVFDVR